VNLPTLGPSSASGRPSPSADRRGFLKTVGVLSAGLSFRSALSAQTGGSGLPTIAFGPVRLSRLICGSNPFNGGSHLSGFVNREMKAYYTPDQVVATLRRCAESGINGWQISGPQNLDLFRAVADAGIGMHGIALARMEDDLAALARGGCMAAAHHGEITDRLFKEGRLDDVREFLGRARDAGMLAGISTHMPDVVDAVESKGWAPDFYMTCVYERNRSNEELKALLGRVPLPAREVYLEEDPPRMYATIRATPRPCLAFKILAAGRLSDRKEAVERAYREAFEGIKPTDGVIVGIYDRYSDQAAEGAALTRKYG